MIYITRKEQFSASHLLANAELTAEENSELFGKCNNLHGHNYYLEVTVCGTPDPRSGYVMDLKYLKEIITQDIISKVDHRFLNEIEMFRDVIPTTENMAMIFWEILSDRVKTGNAQLYSVKIYETAKNFVLYKGER